MPYPYNPALHRAHLLLGDPQAQAFEKVCKFAETLNSMRGLEAIETPLTGYDLCLLAESHRNSQFDSLYIKVGPEGSKAQVKQELWGWIGEATNEPEMGPLCNFIIPNGDRNTGRSTRQAVEGVSKCLAQPGKWTTINDHYYVGDIKTSNSALFMAKNILNCLGISWQMREIKNHMTGHMDHQVRIEPRPIDRIYK